MTKAQYLLGALLLLAPTLHAAPKAKPAEAAFPDYRVSEGKLDQDGLPMDGARLCLQRQPVCFQTPHLAAKNSPEVVYEFGLEPAAMLAPVHGGGSVVLFASTFSGGGSGLLIRLNLLRYSPAKKTLEDLLPETTVSEISNYDLWQIGTVSRYPLLVMANAYWDFSTQETHYAPHRFFITVLAYDTTSGRYKQVLRYRTARKYASEDPVVLKPERRVILQRLNLKTAL
jgi:hypothetical protein